MSLQAELDALKQQSKARIPLGAQAIMERAVEDVRRSGLLATTKKVGDKAPGFTLPNGAGAPVNLSGLLTKGPAVLSFYRGRW